jgi:hypothetical protein
VGVPLITPVDELINRPPGNPDALQLPVQPVCASVTLYAEPAVPPGSGEVVVIEQLGVMVIENTFAADP